MPCMQDNSQVFECVYTINITIKYRYGHGGNIFKFSMAPDQHGLGLRKIKSEFVGFEPQGYVLKIFIKDAFN